MSRLDSRIKNFQKGLDPEQVRKRLEEGAVELRKKKRIEHISKKRAMITDFGNQASAHSEVNSDGILDASLISSVLLEIQPQLGSAEIESSERLSMLIDVIRRYDDLNVLKHAVYTLRVILSSNHAAPLETVVQSGIVGKIIELLDSSDDTIKLESTWCITNIAFCPSHITAYLIGQGAIESVFKLLTHSNKDIVFQAMWALGNLAGDSVEHRDKIIELGTVKILLKLLDKIEEISDNNLSTIVWFLSNLLKGKPQPSSTVRNKIVGYLPDIFKSTDENVLSDACWCTCYITDGDNSGIEFVIKANIVGKILDLIHSSNITIQTPAVRVIGNIASGEDTHAQTLINLGVIDKILPLLTTAGKNIKKESLWALSNLIAGTSEQIELVLLHPIFKEILKLGQHVDIDIKKEAVWCITNASYVKNVKSILKLVNLGVMDVLVECLDCSDARIIIITLDAVNNILSAGNNILINDDSLTYNPLATKFDEIGGLAKIENLQNHASQSIYAKVVAIMDAYYGLEEADEETDRKLKEIPSTDNFVFS